MTRAECVRQAEEWVKRAARHFEEPDTSRAKAAAEISQAYSLLAGEKAYDELRGKS